MPRNLVLCLDGTSNEPETGTTNVALTEDLVMLVPRNTGHVRERLLNRVQHNRARVLVTVNGHVLDTLDGLDRE